MSTRDLTPEEEAEARDLARGDYGALKSRFPLRCAMPVVIQGWDQHRSDYRNGSIALVELPSGTKAGITCWHVVQSYRRRRDRWPNTELCIGNTPVDLEARLIDEDEQMDLAVLDLGELELGFTTREAIGIEFHKPTKWPPGSVIAREDALHLAGFPEVFRHEADPAVVQLETLALAGQSVISARSNLITVEFDRAAWIGWGRGQDLRQLSGMSGGPAFVSRWEPLEYFELVGVMSDFSDGFDVAFIRPVGAVTQDGTLDRTKRVVPR